MSHKQMKLPEPIIFTKKFRKGIAKVIQFILELGLIITSFVVPLWAIATYIGIQWIGVYTMLFVFAFIAAVMNGYYS